MTYLIHGATGAQGAPVAAALHLAGLPVTAAVRDPSRYGGPGTAVAVDLSDPDSLTEAYRSAEGVFLHLPVGAPDRQLAQAEAIIAAVGRARPARVVISTSGNRADDSGATGVLVRGVRATGVSTAVVEPRLYLENLLLPVVTGPVRSEGVLRYPIRDDYPVSWSSHLDVADVVARLLQDDDVTGVVGVGALPGLVGPDLASGFARHLSRDVRFEAQDPVDFGAALVPMFGADAAGAVAGSYVVRLGRPDDVLEAASSAQALLGLTPRSIEDWLRDLSV